MIATPYDNVAGDWFEPIVLAIKWISATGVPLFFVISGFCIHLGQARHEGVESFRFGAFWKRRLWRLYPTYFVALCLSIGLLLTMLVTRTGAEPLARYPEPRAVAIATDGVVHALMLHGLHPFFDQGAGNPPFWTLAREEYLYLMYPLILLMRRRLSWVAVASLMAALTVTIELLAPRLTSAPDWAALITSSAPALWIQWHLGSVAADAYRGAIHLPVFCRQARWVPIWLLVAYLVPFATIWLAMAFFTTVNACVRREAEGRWPTSGPVNRIARMGLWSYSLYLIHHPVQTVALSVALRIIPVAGPGTFVVRAVVLTAISCVAGKMLFDIVERHFVSTSRRAAASG